MKNALFVGWGWSVLAAAGLLGGCSACVNSQLPVVDGGSDEGEVVGPPVCGNGQIEGTEQCDDGNTAGGDGCSSTCTNEVVPSCGDGILQAGEQCDDGSANSDTAQGACRTICRAAGCGDAVVDYVLGEQCDDANTIGGDGCSPTCGIEASPTCGDGNLDLAAGEQCDDGNTSPGDGCSPSCQFEPVGQSCGDGTVDSNEVCDDGNTSNGDACNPTCNLANTTSLFAGTVGAPGLADGVGTVAQFGGFGTITVDAVALWVADGGNNVIRRVEVATADVVTAAGDSVVGMAGNRDDAVGLLARFAGPNAITTDGATVWIADSGNRTLRAMSTMPPYAVTTVAGSGAQAHTDGIGAAAEFDDLRGVAYYGGYVYLLDGAAATLRRFDPATNAVLTLAGSPYATGVTDGLGASARFISPRYIASDNSGMLYVADTNGNTIRSYNTVTSWVGTFAGTGACGYLDGVGTMAAIHRPRGMTSDGTSIYWVEFNAHTIRQGVLATASATTLVGTPPICSITCSCPAPPPGGYLEGTGSAAQLDGPFSVAFHYPSNSLFFFDGGNAVIRRIR